MSLNGFIARSFVWMGTGKMVSSFGFGGGAQQLTDFFGCSELSNMPLAFVTLKAVQASDLTLSNTPAASLELQACEASSATLSNEPAATATLKTEKC